VSSGPGLNLRIVACQGDTEADDKDVAGAGFMVEFLNSSGDEALMRVSGFATHEDAQSFARDFMVKLMLQQQAQRRVN
jgi:hypothetical protein